MIKMHTIGAEKLFEARFMWFPEVGEEVEIIGNNIPLNLRTKCKGEQILLGKIVNVNGEYISVKLNGTKRTGEYYRGEIRLVGNFFFSKTKKLKTSKHKKAKTK